MGLANRTLSFSAETKSATAFGLAIGFLALFSLLTLATASLSREKRKFERRCTVVTLSIGHRRERVVKENAD